jgi:hypothetical protein
VSISYQMEIEDKSVRAMLTRVETMLEPASIAGFLMSAVVPYLQKRGKMRFESEGDDVSGKWLPLTEGTQAIRSAAGYGAEHPINVRSGELKDYIIGSTGMPTVEAGGATLTYPGTPPGNTDLKNKLAVAQSGGPNTQAGYRPTPARPVLGLNEADLASVTVMLAIFLYSGRTDHGNQ